MSDTARFVKHIDAKHLKPGNWSSSYSDWISRARNGIPPACVKFKLEFKIFPCDENESNILATNDWQLIDVSADASSKILKRKIRKILDKAKLFTKLGTITTLKLTNKPW